MPVRKTKGEQLEAIIEDWKLQLGKLDGEYEALKAERRRVESAAANRADLRACVDRMLREHAAQYPDILGKQLRVLARNPYNVRIPSRQKFGETWRIIIENAQEGALFFACADLVRERLLKEVEQVEIQGEGLPMSERAAAVADLDKRMETVAGKAKEIREKARSMGIILGPHPIRINQVAETRLVAKPRRMHDGAVLGSNRD